MCQTFTYFGGLYRIYKIKEDISETLQGPWRDIKSPYRKISAPLVKIKGFLRGQKGFLCAFIGIFCACFGHFLQIKDTEWDHKGPVKKPEDLQSSSLMLIKAPELRGKNSGKALTKPKIQP